MKIIIFLKKWQGGVGVVIKNIKKELEKRGHIVLCFSREDNLKIKSSVLNLRFIRKKYLEIIKKENPDIIYTQDWSMALPLLFPKIIFKNKHFCCFHGNQLGKSKILQTIVGKLLGKNLLVVGDSLKKNFKKSNKVYNGVDLNRFRNLHKKRKFLGWIKKDTEILTKEEVLILAEKENLKPIIIENFSIPFNKMNEKFYNRCKIFLSLPPKTAGFNLCWVEAMAAGVPFIIGNNEGVGCKLPIDKFKSKEDLFNNLSSIKKRKYRSIIEKSDLTWENHVNKLLKIWGKDEQN